MSSYQPFYINGMWVQPQTGATMASETFTVLNPANEAPITKLISASSGEVDLAVQSAREAFSSWSQTSVATRVALFEKLKQVYQDNIDVMARLISQEMGAPIDFAREEQAECGLGHISTTLEVLKNYHFEQKLGPTRILKEPIGVCALITPWNWPINQIACKVAPALAAGCAVVLKPSELTPLSAHLFAQLIHDAGFPPGVFNLVHGTGISVGAQLSQHPDIEMVSFTGSTRAGVAVSKAAADTVKRVTLELGGKSPSIVFEDADIEFSIRHVVKNCMENTGQSCNAPTRLLVHKPIYDQAVAIAAAAAQAVQVASPEQHGQFMGPLISAVQFERVQQLIETGLQEGAKLIAGGPGRPEGFEKGYFCRPTVFADVNNAMYIARTEIFGPVLCILPFEDEHTAIQIANDTPYGLAAYVYTQDMNKAERVARRLRAGMVRVNGAAHPYTAPFGGYKHSGNGREWGLYGLEDFLETKALNM